MYNKTIISSKNKPTLNSGNYIWIIGGTPEVSIDDVQGFSNLAPSSLEVKSSIWSIAKHRWITGPQLPNEILQNTQAYTLGLIEAI